MPCHSPLCAFIPTNGSPSGSFCTCLHPCMHYGPRSMVSLSLLYPFAMMNVERRLPPKSIRKLLIQLLTPVMGLHALTRSYPRAVDVDAGRSLCTCTVHTVTRTKSYSITVLPHTSSRGFMLALLLEAENQDWRASPKTGSDLITRTCCSADQGNN